MGLKKKFKSRLERDRYVKQLTELSSMPSHERQKWQKLLPSMGEKEVGEFSDVLEREITELADIYLKVLQRKGESRVADIGVEFDESKLVMNKDDVSNYFDVGLPVDAERLDVAEDAGEVMKETNILRYLIANASFIGEQKKEKMIENASKLPLQIIKKLQMVIIREGLRALKARQFQLVTNQSFHSPQTLTKALI